MSFELGRLVLDEDNWLAVDEPEVTQAISYRAIALAALASEERFNLVLENYAELEGDILQIALNHMLFADTSSEAALDALYRVNRRVVAVLTACRMYLDQMPRHVRCIVGDNGAEQAEFKARLSTHYDGALGYRVMEALRNYAQHCGIPVHSITRGSYRKPDDRGYVHYVTPIIMVSELQEDRSFKRSVLKELRALGKAEFDIKPFTRQYITAFADVHAWFRRTASPVVRAADRFFEAAAEKYTAHSGRSATAGLTYVERREDGTRTSRASVAALVVTRRRWLEKKNQALQLLDRKWVSGEVWSP